jgi:hypothetical protein
MAFPFLLGYGQRKPRTIFNAVWPADARETQEKLVELPLARTQ